MIKNKKTIGVAILGGTGYGAGETLRLLLAHPEATVASVVSSSAAGKKVEELHPHLHSFYPGTFSGSLDAALLERYEHKFIVLGLPHGASAQAVTELLPKAEQSGIKLIDLSGDFRLSDAGQREAFYQESEQIKELQRRFVYGLTELNRPAIAEARCIANPGCFPTAAALAVRPLISMERVGPIIFDAKTGSSGAGRNPQASFHHPERHGNVNAYKVLGHRHEPEICQALGDPSGKQIETSFVPHVIPSARGLYVTAHLTLTAEQSEEELTDTFRSFYQDCPFVRVREHPAELQNVVGSNFCDISVSSRGRQVVVTSAIDNLVKGMAGQAIQNINLMAGLPETTGLWQPALRPV